MSRLPIVVVADDLTGAAEIAAVGLRHGLSATVVSHSPTDACSENVGGVFAPQFAVAPPKLAAPFHLTLPTDVDLVVLDTDSRLDAPAVAAVKLATLGAVLANFPCALLYKKTDSVLRGPVRAELEALAGALGFSRVLLVPANPVHGRLIQAGHYTIHGVPLHETAFSHDPHHPARTSDVRALLGKTGTLPVSTREGKTALPESGLVIGDAASADDLTHWARQDVVDTLRAGAAGFFSALLRERGFAVRPPAHLVAAIPPILIVSGTTSPGGVDFRERARQTGIPIVLVPGEILRPDPPARAFEEWTGIVRSQLSRAGRVLVFYDGPISSDERTAPALRSAFARLTQDLVRHDAVRHVIVEGGATAAAITRALAWDQLKLIREWAPGVALLQPIAAPPISLTLKPGSYVWPTALWQNVLHSDPKSLPA